MKKMVTALLIILFCFTARLHAGPLTFSSALPLPLRQNVVREMGMFMSKKNDSGAKVSARAFTTVFGLSLNDKIALFTMVPVLNKELKMGNITRSTNGLGDVKIFGRLTVHVKDDEGRTKRAAFLAGAKIPTGEFHANDALGDIPRPLQTGTGSWDGFFGATYSDQSFDKEWDSALEVSLKGTRDGYSFGSEIALNSSYQHRFLPKTLGSGVPAFLYGILELNVIGQLKDKTNGVSLDNTGGFLIRLVPGAQYVTKRWVAEAGVIFAVVQDVPRAAMKDKTSFVAGVTVNF